MARPGRARYWRGEASKRMVQDEHFINPTVDALKRIKRSSSIRCVRTLTGAGVVGCTVWATAENLHPLRPPAS
jgi:hypothetical protein